MKIPNTKQGWWSKSSDRVLPSQREVLSSNSILQKKKKNRGEREKGKEREIQNLKAIHEN
jgi:hypothetical protein